jgi:hypothetical protein
MNTNLSPKERRNARIVLYGESLFVILPFFIMVMISYRQNTLSTILDRPEWSLAATILFGQTLVRFAAGLLKHRGQMNWQVASFWLILILVLVVLSSVNYVLQLNEEPSLSSSIIQLVLFLVSLASFIVFGGIGQMLIDRAAVDSRR